MLSYELKKRARAIMDAKGKADRRSMVAGQGPGNYTKHRGRLFMDATQDESARRWSSDPNHKLTVPGR